VKDGVVTKYISAADMKVAQVKGTGVSYYHKDHLNSSTVMTNNSGTKVEETAYAPYGTMRAFTGTAVTNYRYTGKEIDPETNLYYYGARYYDPMMGRFVTADSIVSDIYDPQDLNRYAYCRNNPMKYVDPDGYAWFDAIPGTIGAVGNFGATGLAYVFTRPAIGALWLIDPKGAAQANSGLNDAFGRVLHIQTGIAASAVVGDTAGAAVGAGVQYVKNARQAARATAEVAKEVQAASKNLPSTLRQTTPGEKFIRYESGHPRYSKVTSEGGLKPGTYTAPGSEGILPKSQLPSRYNLPDPQIPRNTYYEVTPPAGTWVEGPKPVMGGSGSEVIFPNGAPPYSVRPARPVQ